MLPNSHKTWKFPTAANTCTWVVVLPLLINCSAWIKNQICNLDQNLLEKDACFQACQLSYGSLWGFLAENDCVPCLALFYGSCASGTQFRTKPIQAIFQSAKCGVAIPAPAFQSCSKNDVPRLIRRPERTCPSC